MVEAYVVAQAETGVEMITIPELVAQALGSFLTAETKGRFGATNARLPEILPYAARLTLECIGNSDALYHNLEHSMLVTLAGHDILIGRAMLRPTTPEDYAIFIIACLTHDIGYVRGIVQGDSHDSYVADVTGRTICLPRGSSDAALGPYHVDRSKLFVFERLELQRGFRRLQNCPRHRAYALSLRAIVERRPDRGGGLAAARRRSIGQLGDPNYMKKANALFYEFEEVGMNKTLGYDTPADIIYNIGNFTGRTSLRKFRRRSAISMLPPAGASGSPISTATCSGQSARWTFRARNYDLPQRPGRRQIIVRLRASSPAGIDTRRH